MRIPLRLLPLLIFATVTAHAANMALVADTDSIKLKIAALPGQDAKAELNLIAWEGGRTDASSGVMVYTGGNTPPRDFHSLNKAGPFTIHDVGHGTMVSGSLVPAMDLFFQGSKDPVLVKVSGAKVDANELFDAYQAFQGHGAANATKDQMQKRIDAGIKSYRSACGGSAKLSVDWTSFEKAKALPWAGAAYGALTGLSALCAQKSDYKAELAKISTFEINWQDTPAGEIKIVRSPGKIKISFAHLAYNPREAAPEWAKKDF